MTSTVSSRGAIIDCRLLTVSAEFVEMTEVQINQLTISFYEKIEEIFNNECYLNWSFEGRKVKDIESALLKQKKPNGCFSLLLGGAVRSKLVYNAKSFKENEKDCIYGQFPSSNYSQDYKTYYEQNIQYHVGEQLKDNVLRLFSETGRYYEGYYNANDLKGFFGVTCERESGLYYGHFEFQVSAYSLQSDVDRISRVFAEYLRCISCEFNSINSRISLMPTLGAISNWHCYYFYSLPSYVEATVENMRCWRGAMYTYIHGAEWFNIVSPRTISELPVPTNSYCKEQITIDTLKNGALQVNCTADISKVDVEEIRNIKLFLYNYLLPGMRAFPLGAVTSNISLAPRRMWEICPMFSDEVEVTDHKLIFKHNGIYYPKKLKFDNW